MLNITEQAKRQLKNILDTHVKMPQARLRLCDRGGGELGLGIDIEEPEDNIIEYQGSRIMVVKRQLASRLDAITIDVDNTANGQELVICGNIAG